MPRAVCSGFRAAAFPTSPHKEVERHLARYSEKAALIHRHPDEERRREVAAGLDDLVRAERVKNTTGRPLSGSTP